MLMIFLNKLHRGDFPPELTEHMARTWRVGVPYEKDIVILDKDGLRKMPGDWFVGNLERVK